MEDSHNLEAVSVQPTPAAPEVEVNDPAAIEHSQPFVGQWNKLVSTTNWEKGAIILKWRNALQESGIDAQHYSDEKWARTVGGVTGQHVGRLRRVSEKFEATRHSFDGLYWSHFLAALDWDDAEMWLEGAVQSKWSVSQMRRQRWEAMGGEPSQEPKEGDIVSSDIDEDFEPAAGAEPGVVTGEFGEVVPGPLHEGPDFGDDDGSASGSNDTTATAEAISDVGEGSVDLVRPFANLAALPEDLAEAFDAFKLALLRHKTDGWEEVSLEDVVGALDSLKQLATAPSTS